jgi:hypothetical protein
MVARLARYPIDHIQTQPLNGPFNRRARFNALGHHTVRSTRILFSNVGVVVAVKRKPQVVRPQLWPEVYATSRGDGRVLVVAAQIEISRQVPLATLVLGHRFAEQCRAQL